MLSAVKEFGISHLNRPSQGFSPMRTRNAIYY